jgi:hypothetical protein
MNFDGALITDQGVTFGLLIVKQHLLHDPTTQRQMRSFGTRIWGRIPIVLMAQDHKGTPTYQGRRDIVQFLAHIDIRRIPFKRWTVTPKVA